MRPTASRITPLKVVPPLFYECVVNFQLDSSTRHFPDSWTMHRYDDLAAFSGLGSAAINERMIADLASAVYDVVRAPCSCGIARRVTSFGAAARALVNHRFRHALLRELHTSRIRGGRTATLNLHGDKNLLEAAQEGLPTRL